MPPSSLVGLITGSSSKKDTFRFVERFVFAAPHLPYFPASVFVLHTCSRFPGSTYARPDFSMIVT